MKRLLISSILSIILGNFAILLNFAYFRAVQIHLEKGMPLKEFSTLSIFLMLIIPLTGLFFGSYAVFKIKILKLIPAIGVALCSIALFILAYNFWLIQP